MAYQCYHNIFWHTSVLDMPIVVADFLTTAMAWPTCEDWRRRGV
jgi:hypothetical protein